MAVKIKLKRLGKIREPYYRIVIADSRTKRDGRSIEEIGKYHPKAEPSFIEVNSERVLHWLSVGAQPTDPVRRILEITGDWQKFKGLPGAEGTLRTAEPKADKKAAFAVAVAETLTDAGAAPAAKTSRAKTRDAKAGDAKAGDAKAGGAKAVKAAEAKSAGVKAGVKATKADATATEAASSQAGTAQETGTTEVAGPEPTVAEDAEPEGSSA